MAVQPKMADVTVAERNDLLKEKLAMCAVVYDFAEVETHERDQKRQILLGAPFATPSAAPFAAPPCFRRHGQLREVRRHPSGGSDASPAKKVASCALRDGALDWVLITFVSCVNRVHRLYHQEERAD